MALSLFFPDNQQHIVLADDSNLAAYLDQGWEVLAPDGHAYNVQSFQGGWLYDGCPLNVIEGRGWFDGQIAALQIPVALGSIMACPFAPAGSFPPPSTPAPDPGSGPTTGTPPGSGGSPTSPGSGGTVTSGPSSGVGLNPPNMQTFDFISATAIGTAVGGPVGTVVGVVIDVLGALWGIFGGSSDDKIVNALHSITSTLTSIVNVLMALVLKIARALAKIMGLIKNVFEQLLQPIVRAIKAIQNLLIDIINKLLGPMIAAINWINQQLRLIYDRYWRPVIQVISQVRRVLNILAALHVPFAKQIDAKLARIQAKIFAPISAILRAVNQHGGILNLLLSARWILQGAIWRRSAYVYRSDLVNLWWDAQTESLGRTNINAPIAGVPPLTASDGLAQLSLVLDGNEGSDATATSGALLMLDETLGSAASQGLASRRLL